MSNWFIRYVTEPRLSRFENIGTSVSVAVIVTNLSVRGLLIAFAVMLATAAIVSIIKAMKDMK